MKYCGIELKGNDAIIVSIATLASGYSLIAKDIKKITLKDSDDQGAVQLFTKELYAFLDTMQFDQVAIKERGKKGKFAGGPVSFKIEGILQNAPYPVTLIHGATLRAKMKGVELDGSAVNSYQMEALNVAVSLTL